MINIIFLDIDGVLNPDDNFIREAEVGRRTTDVLQLDSGCLHNLAVLIKATRAHIVLTSSWRYASECTGTMKNLIAQFDKVGLSIYDTVPIISACRGEEIKDG